MFLRRVNGLINGINTATAKSLLGVVPDHNNGTLFTHFIESLDKIPFTFNSSGGNLESINVDSRQGILSTNVQTVNNYQVLYPNTWSNPPISVNSNSKLELQYTFKLNTLATVSEDYVVLLGLSSTIDGSYPTDGIYVRYSNATNGKLECVCINSNTSTTSSIDVNLDTSTWYTLLINYDLTTVKFTLVNTNTVVNINTNIPTNKYLFYISGIKKLVGSSNTIKLYLDYIRLSWTNDTSTIGSISGSSTNYSFSALTFGSTTNWDTANAAFSNRTLTVTGNTTLNITNSINGQLGTLIITSSAYCTITLPGFKKAGTTKVLSIGDTRVYYFFYDGTNYYWEDYAYSSTGVANDEVESSRFENFLGNTDYFVGSISTNGTGTSSTITNTSTGNLGILQLDTGTTATGRAASRSAIAISLGNSYIELEFYFRIRTLNDISNQFTIYAGFANTNSALPTTGAYIYYDSTSTNIFYTTKSNNAITSVNSGFTPVSNTFYKCKLVISKANSITFTIDDANSQTITTTIPAFPIGIVFYIQKSLGTNNRHLDIDWYKFYTKIVD